jgi:hypothetical protein
MFLMEYTEIAYKVNTIETEHVASHKLMICLGTEIYRRRNQLRSGGKREQSTIASHCH